MSERFGGDPFASEEITPAISAEWEARRRVAETLRHLHDTLASSAPAVEVLDALDARLGQAVAQLAAAPRIYGRSEFARDGSHGNFRQIAHEINPLSGMGNPLAPPLNIWLENGVAHGRATLGWAYEGPPGSVHGGYVAALFDQFLGMAQALGGKPGMTGTLAVRFHRPTPLNTLLVLNGWLESVEGRKTRVRAEMHADGVLTASSDGLFVQPLGGFAAAAARRG